MTTATAGSRRSLLYEDKSETERKKNEKQQAYDSKSWKQRLKYSNAFQAA